MKLSPAAELAIRGTLILTQQYGKGSMTLADICKQRDLSREYLAKVFGQLARADIITPIRGKNGGYVLARDPKHISLLDVIAAVEGPQYLNLCQCHPPKCDNAETCKVCLVWTELQGVFEKKLGSVTLAECI